MVFPLRLLLSSFVWQPLLLPITAYDYSDVTYEAGQDPTRICTANEILAGKKGCLVMTGRLLMHRRPFTDSLQEHFHSLRTIAGHVVLDDSSLVKLHAFKNVWDIDITDPVDWSSTRIQRNPEFVVKNNPNLTEIDLGSLLSYTSTYSGGFIIRDNGNYRMSWKQRNELYQMTNNRNLYDDIDMENPPRKVKSNTFTAVAYLFLVPLILLLLGWILLVCFYRSANRVFTEVHSRPYEEMLNESNRTAEGAKYAETPQKENKEKTD